MQNIYISGVFALLYIIFFVAEFSFHVYFNIYKMKKNHKETFVCVNNPNANTTNNASPYTICDESSYLIEKQKCVNEKESTEESYSNSICSSLIAMLQGVEVLCYYSIMFIYKDNYQLNPASLNIMMSVIRLPWSMKLLWAIFSDSFPVFGFRRKYYLLLGSLFCIISTLTLGLIEHNNIMVTTWMLILYFWGGAICNVIGEGQVVENGRKGSSSHSAKTVSMFFAFRKFSFAFMAYLSGYLLSVMTKQHIFLIGSILPIAVFISSFFLQESRNHRVISMKRQLRYVVDIVKIPSIKNSIIFIFIMMITPSCGNVLFYFMTNELKFSPELLGKMTMFQSIASLAAILAYMMFFTETDIHKLLMYSTIIVTPFCLLPVVVVKRWNQFLYIPDSAFIMTDTVLLEFVGEFQSLPLLVLCSHIIPEGLESTIYSLLLTANNAANALSSFVSSFLTYELDITSTNFSNLPLMIVICALTNLLPIFFVYMLPKTVDSKSPGEDHISIKEKGVEEKEERSVQTGWINYAKNKWGRDKGKKSLYYNENGHTGSSETLIPEDHNSENRACGANGTILESFSEASTLKDEDNVMP